MRKVSGPELKLLSLTLEEIFELLDEDWLYDLLPGNGEDDYILGKLKERLMHKALEQDLDRRS